MSLRAIKARSLGRLELLAWMNSLLESDYTKVEHLGDGVAYLQVLDAVFRDAPLHKLDFNAVEEKDRLCNLRLVQSTLHAHNVKKEIPVHRLAKCKFADNHELLQWCYDYVHRTYPDSNYNYHAQEARERAMASGLSSGRKNTGGKADARRKRSQRKINDVRPGRSGTHGTRKYNPSSTEAGSRSPIATGSSPQNSNLLPSNHLNNSLRPGLIRSPPQDAILGGGASSPPLLDLGNYNSRGMILSSFASNKDSQRSERSGVEDYFETSDSDRSGAVDGTHNLRESRIPVSKAFFSNIYNDESAQASCSVDSSGEISQTSRQVPLISDSSLYAGIVKYSGEPEDGSRALKEEESYGDLSHQVQQVTEGTVREPKKAAANLQAELLSKIPKSGSPGGFLERLDAAVKESPPIRSTRDTRRLADSSSSPRGRARDVAEQGQIYEKRKSPRVVSKEKFMLQKRIAELESTLTSDILSQRELEDAVENVRVERDFYYDTLRAIEGALYRRFIAQPDLEGTETAHDLLEILEKGRKDQHGRN